MLNARNTGREARLYIEFGVGQQPLRSFARPSCATGGGRRCRGKVSAAKRCAATLEISCRSNTRLLSIDPVDGSLVLGSSSPWPIPKSRPAHLDARRPTTGRRLASGASASLGRLFAAALALCVWLSRRAAPGAWFPARRRRRGRRGALVVAGIRRHRKDELVVTAVDGSGTAVITVETDFRSNDYARSRGTRPTFRSKSNLRLLWRTDYAPGKLNSAPLTVRRAGCCRRRSHGTRTGSAASGASRSAFRVRFPAPFRIRGVTAKPMGAFEIAGDRCANGSRSKASRELDQQRDRRRRRAGSAAAGAARGRRARCRGRAFGLRAHAGTARIAARVLAALFVTAWLVQDARWIVDLCAANARDGAALRRPRLARATSRSRGRRAVRFIEKVRAKLPAATGARVHGRRRALLLADAAPIISIRTMCSSIPTPMRCRRAPRLRSGDFVVVYQRRGVQYDPGAAALALGWRRAGGRGACAARARRRAFPDPLTCRS